MRKGIALFLVIALIALLLPTPAYGVATSAEALQQQIRDTYRKALKLNNYVSFSGWCATLVSWQTYLLGIDTLKYGYDGNGVFDLYRKMETTTGGYRVKSYSASQYTLQEALNAITDHGKLDAYNIVVGFQRTNTAAGKMYGHACFIHGIVDGIVYFMESYNTGFNDRYWAEGTPISCTIEEFCNYYNSWTVLDGVIYFGVKTYANLCQSYPANMSAMTAARTSVMSEPVDAGINESDAVVAAAVSKGEILQVTQLLKTPGGSYWYAVQSADARGYLPAEMLIPMEANTKDVSVENIKVPTAIHKGYGFVVGGTIAAQFSDLKQVTVNIYSGSGEEKIVHCTAQVETRGKQYSLNTAAIDNKMTFRKLPEGIYRLSVSAVVTNYAAVGSELVLREETVELWNSEFRVVGGWNHHYTVTFDAMGGISGTDKTAVAAGEALGTLPTPVRSGYAFVGWYTQPEGGEALTEDMIVNGNVTAYARWIADGADHTGWLYTENGWCYLENGSTGNGWFTTGSVSFYRNPDGSVPTGWTQIEGKQYYFNALGAAQTGWLELDGKRYFLHSSGEMANGWLQMGGKHYWFAADGAAQNGWLEVDGATYYFDMDGACVTGEVSIDEKLYNFHEDGRLVTGWVQREGKTIYLDAAGEMVTGWYNIDGVACYFGSDGALYLTANDSCSYGCLLNTGIVSTQP